ncbi:hypothetical protein ACIF85_45580 [Streptomyces sp. NPDC086033]|uniref:hypothetical protein n=1 Tax=Streptomyces sp. NPDC086033 TaxID=3365747 RepID=UPI0037CD3388
MNIDRAVTERAVTPVRDTNLTRGEAARTGRSIMAQLPGFRTGDAVASAILTAAAPTPMAVYDRRAQHALNTHRDATDAAPTYSTTSSTTAPHTPPAGPHATSTPPCTGPAAPTVRHRRHQPSP